jgi:Fe-S-cluster containining protein
MTEGLIMICQRCGFCCNHLDVMIINPRSIRSDGTIDSEDRNSLISKPEGEKCPHLAYSGEVAVCTIHDLPCYRGTPCDLFDQFGPEDGPCILGGYFKSSRSAKL